MAGISASGSSIDVAGLVSQLVAADRAPASRWNTQRLAALSRQTTWGDLSAKLNAVRTAAEALDTGRKASPSAATSSDPKVLSATGLAGAAPSSTTIRVDALATSQQRTSGGLTGPAALVGAGTAVLTSGLAATGMTRLLVDAGLPAGRHTVLVRPPQAAQLEGTAPPELDLTTGSTDLTVTGTDGVPRTVTLPAQQYASASALASALETALQPPGGGAGPSVSVRNGALVVSSPDTGPNALLSIDDSGVASRLGLAAAWSYGTDVTASLDGGDPVELVAGEDTRLTNAAGEGATLSAGPGPLSAGTIVANVVRTTETSTLQDLTTALNATGSPVSAALVNSGDGTASPWRLILTATEPGSRGAVALDAADSPFLTGLNLDAPASLVAARDATLTIGTTTITRSSNTITDLLPDVTLNLLTLGESTVAVSRDGAGTAARATTLVDGLNAFLTAVASATRPGSNGAAGGVLAGSGSARGLAQQVFRLGASVPGSSDVPSLSSLGIEVTREGRYRLDEAAFTKALQRDPDGVAGVLSSFSASLVAYATSATGADGPIKSAGQMASDQAADRQKQMDALDLRLETVRRRYTAQYAKLDAALSVLNSQSARLSSQLGSLGTGF
ncbi:MAG: hypothetical protein JWN57_961 [Frankiales bacterium]|nr:hypothetical protein [Frankiales bacterium]